MFVHWFIGSLFESRFSPTFFVLLYCLVFVSLCHVFRFECSFQLKAHICWVSQTSVLKLRPWDARIQTAAEWVRHVYFTFCRVAPSQRGRDVLSARCLRMNLFPCQTITQTRLVCVLPSYLYNFLYSKLKLVCFKVEPIVFSVSCMQLLFWPVLQLFIKRAHFWGNSKNITNTNFLFFPLWIRQSSHDCLLYF